MSFAYIFDINTNLAISTAVVLALSLRMHYSRYFKRFALPALVAFLVYHSLSPSTLCLSGSPSMTITLEDSVLSTILKVLLINSETNKYWNRFLCDVIGISMISLAVSKMNALFSFNMIALIKLVKDEAYSMVKSLPVVSGYISSELKKEMVKLEDSLKHELKSKVAAMGPVMKSLPSVGMGEEEILKFMERESDKENGEWAKGKVSGSIYHGIQSHQQLLNKAFGMYSLSNPLHPEIWPSAMKYDSEIIAMTASLVSGGLNTVCGCTSSGGTESIILAIKAHRDFYRQVHGILHPELVCCTSAHAAVDKACDLMGIKQIKVRMDPSTFEIDLTALESSIGPNTVMIYGSAPGYPQGVIDPILAMGKIAARYDIGLHVDCCLGGFVLPFAKKLGYNIPDFDFTVPGVTSMSLDTHKYGYALKGSSVVLYRTKDLRHAQYFSFPDWTGGIYTTPTIAGSRSGGIIAQTWASMVSLGEEGYMKHTKEIMDTTRKIADGVREMKDLRMLGAAQAMIVCFAGATPEVCVYAVSEGNEHSRTTLFYISILH